MIIHIDMLWLHLGGDVEGLSFHLWDGFFKCCIFMLANCLKNAVEASSVGEAVTVDIHDASPVTIRVHNQGPVPEAIRDSFFSKYVTAGKIGGTGLGTYSAKLVAEVHGGSIAMQPSWWYRVIFLLGALARAIDIWFGAAQSAAMRVLSFPSFFPPLSVFFAAFGALATGLCPGFVAPAFAAEAEDPGKVAHVVSRLTYGPSPGDLERVAKMGTAAFFASQLEPERIDEPPALEQALAKLPSEAMNTVRLFREYGPAAEAEGATDPEAMRRVFDRAGAAALEAAEAKLFRAILSRRQLNELMVAFWSEHFNLGDKKGLAHLWAGSFEREAIRPHGGWR